MKQIQDEMGDKKIRFVSGDDKETQDVFSPTLRLLTTIVAPYDILMIDEAQRIRDI